MKSKIFILGFMILAIPVVLACDIGEHGSEVTGAHVGDVYGTGMMGFSMVSYNYLWLILILYLIIGLGYVIYKLSKIENKMEGGKR